MSQERILVLESDPTLSEQICHQLARAGYVPDSASTPEDALAVAKPDELDLLLCDIGLQSTAGLMVLQDLRKKNPTLAAIVITHSDNWELATGAIRNGFNNMLFKPFEPEELTLAVSAALEQEKVRRENLRLRALVPLYELSRTFMATSELSSVLDRIVTTARQETRAEVVSLMLVNDDDRSLSIAAASGLDSSIIESEHPAIGSGIAGWVAANGKPLMIGEGIPLDKSVRRTIGKPDLVSALSLPLQTRGETIGVLNLARRLGAEPFSEADLELATVLAGHAAAAIDRASLFEDMRSLTETSQRLAGALDLSEAASVILEATRATAHVSRAAFWLVEEMSEQLTLLKSLDLSEQDAGVPDLSWFDRSGSPWFEEKRGILWLPLVRAESLFGIIELPLAGNTPPRADRLEILRTLARTATAVIESHRLRAREAIAFRELGETLRSDLNLQQVLERVLAEMVEACRASGGSIFLQGEHAATPEAFVNSGEAAPINLARQIFRENQPLLLPRYNNPEYKSMHSILGVPLTVGARVEGAVILHNRQAGAFAARHLSLLTVLGSSTALIVRNAQLYTRSEEAVISEERTRIAREIHDGIAQDLSLLLLKVEIMRRLLQKNDVDQLEKEFEEMTAALRNEMREVRRTIFALRPLDLESLGFPVALDKFVREFGQSNDIKVRLTITGDASGLSTKLQTAVFRLTQESLNNIRKHARAANIWIELDVDDGWVTLLVRDDGRGFEPDRALPEAQRRGSVGLMHMQERAERAGGSFEFQTAPGQGTLIRARLPVR